MFTGEYRHAVDDKGRLAVPSRFRAQLAGNIVVAWWLDACLAVFPMAAWEVIAAKVAGLPMTDPTTRLLPFGLDPTGILEPVEHRIEGALLELEPASTAPGQPTQESSRCKQPLLFGGHLTEPAGQLTRCYRLPTGLDTGGPRRLPGCRLSTWH